MPQILCVRCSSATYAPRSLQKEGTINHSHADVALSITGRGLLDSSCAQAAMSCCSTRLLPWMCCEAAAKAKVCVCTKALTPCPCVGRTTRQETVACTVKHGGPQTPGPAEARNSLPSQTKTHWMHYRMHYLCLHTPTPAHKHSCTATQTALVVMFAVQHEARRFTPYCSCSWCRTQES